MSSPAESFPVSSMCALQDNSVVIRDTLTGQWYGLTDPERIICANRIEEVIPCLGEVEAMVAGQGLIAAGFVSYEAASAFDAALTTHSDDSGFPLLWFALFRERRCLTLPGTAGAPPTLSWQSMITPQAYRCAIERIQQYISAGDTYQVNFSYRLTASSPGAFWPLFVNLAAGHDPEFGAYLNIGRWEIGSLSPELFFRRDGDLLTSIPMKGTIDRGLGAADDIVQADRLRNSVKDRAENVMIVDMVRNDFGRIARPGSIQVADLCTLRRYSTLWQMTSTVSAQVRASLTEVFSALFPAASITGAPKARTMALIRELETMPRRIYTGAIGFLLPDGRAQFNVAIRTLLHDRRQRKLEYGVGGGIVADSSVSGEWKETRIKSLVCREPATAFSLIETLLWCSESGFVLLDAHLRRLQASAEYFAFPCDIDAVRERLAAAMAESSGEQLKIRLLIDRHGTMVIETAPLPLLPVSRPFRLALAEHAVDSANPFLYHKTTRREVYEQARADAPAGADDVLFYNQNGELTETTIANLVLTLDGRRYTPPIHCGLLPGTFRQHLLETGAIEERCLAIDCLARAENITLINSVRGQWLASLL